MSTFQAEISKTIDKIHEATIETYKVALANNTPLTAEKYSIALNNAAFYLSLFAEAAQQQFGMNITEEECRARALNVIPPASASGNGAAGHSLDIDAHNTPTHSPNPIPAAAAAAPSTPTHTPTPNPAAMPGTPTPNPHPAAATTAAPGTPTPNTDPNTTLFPGFQMSEDEESILFPM
ncbi:hypothetical protein DFH08DRAFT_952611 [Mycena albidolilacea]|uniref:Uncharacterized protein n=1 Tax=Mycena albidolilacea TaxID=1033008 RepID=A0AAD7AIS1_9AGAR|nr:hypothetical protein DFH08DRAFT_952611 [Mycena albidolilacea]